jgi:DNA-binding SARP family transcriptional activator
VSEAATLELRLLGDMELRRGDERLELPPSRKTRALLAYLALTGRPHRRDRLCGLLWDVADDPRGALRWSLSRLRAIVDEPGRPRIHSGGDSVAFDASGAWIDVLALRQRAAPGLDRLARGELERLAGEFRGELLEGLDLGDFLDFQAWCVAEREEARKLHARVLRALIERLSPEPEAALPHARALAAVDPLDETARASLVRLLAATGRRREAERQYHAARRLLQELGRPAGAELEAAWGKALRAPAALATEPARAIDDRSALVPTPPALVGRQRELERLEAAVAQAGAGLRVELVTGEPGVGKSSLLGTLRDRLRARGLAVLEGRAYEAEAGRPFGPWIDALRQLPADTGLVGPDLAALLPELALEGAAPRSRDRLFAAALELLVERQAAAPIVLALEDVHWLDAGSAELLHYVARSARERRLLIALTARAGELADNEPVQRVLRGLRELGVLEARELPALGRDETRALVHAVSAGVDAERVFGESGGNPLFALELARSLSERDELSGSLAALVRGRVERLPSEAGDVLRWAAVLGSTFSAERLGGLVALGLDRLLAALELLERHALLRASARGGYEWSHELVRRAVYSELSQPRRRLMHLRVAERLRAAPGDEAAAELAHHAALGGDSVVAARACALAGRAFLRQFANEDAWTIARRGRRHAADTAGAERTRLLLELLQVELQARRPADTAAAARELEALAEQALADGSADHARLGFRMLAYLSWEEGALGDAQRQMMRAELVSRAGDERTQVEALAEAARCLVLLERELPRAEALALEARARGERAGARPAAIPSAQGMLRQHQGRYDEAAELFEQARAAARRDDDRMGEFQALEQLVLLRQEQGDWPEALRLGRELLALGAKLREGSEAPFARGLLALSGVALGESGASAALEAALEELRVADAKLRLAYTLTRAARLDIARGDLGQARVRSEEAHRAAAALGRPTELLLAGLTLVRACRLAGDAERAERLARELRTTPLANASALARRELSALEVAR